MELEELKRQIAELNATIATLKEQQSATPPDIETLVAERVEVALKDIKEKLNAAFKQRDDALLKLAKVEEDQKVARQKQMENEGNKLGVLEEQLNETRAKLEVVSRANTELTRDAQVRDAISKFEFKNERARVLCTKEITADLINQDGKWIHKSGVSIAEFAATFAADEDQSFLFKQRSSSGSGSGNLDSNPPKGKKSLFEMTQAEVLEAAARGELPRRK